MHANVKDKALNLDPKPIPAYYCCYLLRSSVRYASLYIGSTPNPSRRLSQHNGHAKGGAKRTSGEKLRPWEMVILVEGFMSRVGALQFEWAWQNPQSSRHIDQETLQSMHISNGASQKSKRLKRRPRSLKSHLMVLHLLLRATYFASWPLRVRFLVEDIYRTWQAWTDRIDGFLPDHLRVFLDANRSYDLDGCPIASHPKIAKGVSHIRVTYDAVKQQAEKANFLLDESEVIYCNVCSLQLSLDNDLIVVCPNESCPGASHLSCLAEHFSENGDDHTQQFVPHEGICPSCRLTIPWTALVKELSLRLRGKEKIDNMFKVKGRRNKPSTRDAQGKAGAFSNDDITEPDSFNDSDLDTNWMEGLDTATDDELKEDDVKASSGASVPRAEIVIDDSEWDDAEIID